MLDKLYLISYNEDNKNKEATKRKASENGGRSNGLLNLTTKNLLTSLHRCNRRREIPMKGRGP